MAQPIRPTIKSLKKGTDFDDGGVPYVKTVWIRMNGEAHANFELNYDKLNVHIRAGKIEIERTKDKNKKKQADKGTTEKETGNGGVGDGQRAGGSGNGTGNDKDQEMEDVSEEELVRVLIQDSGDGITDEPSEAAGSTRRE